MSSDTLPLFVYGTLKKGYRAHSVLGKPKFLGFGYTTTDYKLLDCGGFPGLIKTKNGTNNIEGEIYEISKSVLEQIHEYEGVQENLFFFEYVSISEFDLKNKPNSKLTKLMLNRNLCFGYIFNKIYNMNYREIEYFTLD